MGIRVEKDFLGEKRIPQEAYYGIQTLRAGENFPISGLRVHPELITALAEVKIACARANMELDRLKRQTGEAIVQAAEEIRDGQWLDQFLVDAIQGGAGTSLNMNMNEVIANRALELLGLSKGQYAEVSPTNHVNMSQSTNDTIPTAIRIAAYRLTRKLLEKLEQLASGVEKKAEEFDDIIKMGRTHLQDAVPIRLGQEFRAYAGFMRRDLKRIAQASESLLTVNIGATAVGTGLNASEQYIDRAVQRLRELTGVPVERADNLVDATQNTDVYMELSAALKVCAVNMSKMCNDIRLMASGPRAGLNELSLPARQPGSSIMPGKVNPVIAEVMNQISFQVIGNDLTISLACEAGQFELNVMMPVASHNLLQSLKIMKNGFDVLHRLLIADLEANRDVCKAYVDNSLGIVTALNPHLGYEVASRLVKESLQSGRSIRQLILEKGLLTEEEMNEILDPYKMTSPGIVGEKHLLNQ